MVLIQNSMRYLEEPTILVKLSTLQMTIPFPTVVVCPEIRFPDHKLDAFMNELKTPPGVNRTNIRAHLPQLAAFFSGRVPYQRSELGSLQAVIEDNGLELEATARRLTTSCEETLLECRWLSVPVACTELFTMEVTGDGFCCVFNGRSLRREIADEEVPREDKQSPKLNDNEVGPLNGLVAVIDESQKHDSIDLSYKWVSLKEPQSYVDVPMNGWPLSLSVEHWFAYSTYGLRVRDSSLKALSQDLRRCRMHHDEPLQFFPVYTRSNCLLECELFHTWRLCGCVAVTHPCPPAMRYCRVQDLACTRHARVSFGAPFCNCPKTCDMDMPIVRVFKYLLTPNSSSYDHIYESAHFEERSIIRVFINEYNTKAYEQKPVFSTFDLYSQFGGIFNIYFGCSILSLLEIVIIVIRALVLRYQQFHKQKPNKEYESGKFGGKLIKPPSRRSSTTVGNPKIFNQILDNSSKVK